MDFIKQRTAERESRVAAKEAVTAMPAAEATDAPKGASKLLTGAVNLFFSEEELNAGEGKSLQ